jgi:D-xylonolactonase
MIQPLLIADYSCVTGEGPLWHAAEQRRMSFPAKKVSSVTFGGPDYTDMYITTAGADDKPAEGAGAGALFRLNLGIQGVPEFLSRVGM